MPKRSLAESQVADAVKEFGIHLDGWNESDMKHLDMETALALKINPEKAARLCCRLRSIKEEEAKRAPLNEKLWAAARKGVEVHHGLLWSTSVSLLAEVDRLIRAGAEIDSPDCQGDTALHAACQGSHDDIVARLLRAGASVSSTNAAGARPKVEGFKPLHAVAGDGPFQTVKDLLELKGVKIDEEDELGHSALHIAAKRGRAEVVSALVDKGCTVDAKDKRGRTALHFASSGGHVEVTKFLVKKGADVNSKTTAGTTALHWVAVLGCTETASVLLECGADVNARNNEGYTPLDRTRPSDTKMADLLKAKGGISSLGWWSLKA